MYVTPSYKIKKIMILLKYKVESIIYIKDIKKRELFENYMPDNENEDVW